MRSLWRLRAFAGGLLPAIVLALPMMGLAAWLNVQALSATKPVLDGVFLSGLKGPGHVPEWTYGAAATAAVEDTGAWWKLHKLQVVTRVVRPPEEARRLALEQLTRHAIIFVLVSIAAAIANALSMYIGDFIGQNLLRRLRYTVFGHLQALSISFFDRRRSGELISRVNNDTLVLQRALGADLFKIIVAPLVILFMTIKMISISLPLTLVLTIAIPISGLITTFTARYARRYGRRTQVKMADLTAVTQESFAAVRVIKTFGLEAQAQQRFDREATGVLKAEMKSALVKALGMPPVFGVISGALAATLVYGGYEILHARLDPSALVLFMLFLQVAAAELTSTSRLYVVMQLAEAAAERTLAVLAEQPEVQDAPDAVDLEQVEGRVTFEHVTFSYDGENPVLRDFSLDVAPGEVVALAGPSGAGKSTVANLVPRLYDVEQGRVLIDGHDVKSVRQSSLKRYMGSVPQETILFGASIRENIGYGREGATNDEIETAARAAYAHDFIMGLPDGYDTQVGERGVRLSGGQRQRIAIARAFLRDPRILILDEATSALDTESEAAVHSALETLLEGRTALIIAHRLSTIRNADRIIVMANGVIVEQGGHDELMSRDGLYRRLYESKELLGQAEGEGASDAPDTAVADDDSVVDLGEGLG